MTRGRRAVSEVVAALLILVATVSIFGVYYSHYVNGLSSSGKSVAQGISDSAKATGELMSLVSYQVQGQTVTLYLYDYGLLPITLNPPSQAYLVSGSELQQAQSFAFTDSTSGNSISTMRTQELAKLTLTFGSVPSSFYIDIIDSLGKKFEFQVAASG